MHLRLTRLRRRRSSFRIPICTARLSSPGSPSRLTYLSPSRLVPAHCLRSCSFCSSRSQEPAHSTVDENYDEIRSWFGRAPKAVKPISERSRAFRASALSDSSSSAESQACFSTPASVPHHDRRPHRQARHELGRGVRVLRSPGHLVMRRSHEDRGRISHGPEHGVYRGFGACHGSSTLSPASCSGSSAGWYRDDPPREERPPGHRDVHIHPRGRPRRLVPLGSCFSRGRRGGRDVSARGHGLSPCRHLHRCGRDARHRPHP